MKERMANDIKQAMINKNKKLLAVLRMVKASIQLKEIETKEELTDLEIQEIFLKQIKMRNESLESFKKSDREDLIKEVEEEISILNRYLPPKLTAEEEDELINVVFEKLKPSTKADMKNIISEIKQIGGVNLDMKSISKKINEKLKSN